MTMDSAPRRRPRGLSPSERALWRLAMRDTAPLAGRALEPLPQPAPAEAPAPAVKPAAPPMPRIAPPPAPVALPALTYAGTPGLDRRSAERLKRGQLPIEGRLDLHGMTQAAARSALDGFIAAMQRRGARAILVITGKGGRPGEDGADRYDGRGVLRREVPRWLNELPNRAQVLAFTEAQPQHGGAGALYILLRRQRG
jgi:DNA-nicking Smr family endonuclease